MLSSSFEVVLASSSVSCATSMSPSAMARARTAPWLDPIACVQATHRRRPCDRHRSLRNVAADTQQGLALSDCVAEASADVHNAAGGSEITGTVRAMSGITVPVTNTATGLISVAVTIGYRSGCSTARRRHPRRKSPCVLAAPLRRRHFVALATPTERNAQSIGNKQTPMLCSSCDSCTFILLNRSFTRQLIPPIRVEAMIHGPNVSMS